MLFLKVLAEVALTQLNKLLKRSSTKMYMKNALISFLRMLLVFQITTQLTESWNMFSVIWQTASQWAGTTLLERVHLGVL